MFVNLSAEEKGIALYNDNSSRTADTEGRNAPNHAE